MRQGWIVQIGWFEWVWGDWPIWVGVRWHCFICVKGDLFNLSGCGVFGWFEWVWSDWLIWMGVMWHSMVVSHQKVVFGQGLHCVHPVLHCFLCVFPVLHCVSVSWVRPVLHCVRPMLHCVCPVLHCLCFLCCTVCVSCVALCVFPVLHCLFSVRVFCVALCAFPVFQCVSCVCRNWPSWLRRRSCERKPGSTTSPAKTRRRKSWRRSWPSMSACLVISPPPLSPPPQFAYCPQKLDFFSSVQQKQVYYCMFFCCCCFSPNLSILHPCHFFVYALVASFLFFPCPLLILSISFIAFHI